MTVYELAVKYYPRLWGWGRIEALVKAGRLTQDEAEEIKAQAGSADRAR